MSEALPLALNGTPIITIVRPLQMTDSKKRASIIENVGRRERSSGVAAIPLDGTPVEHGEPEIRRVRLSELRLTERPSGDELKTDDVCFAYFARVLQPNHLLSGTFVTLAALLYIGFVRDEIEAYNSENGRHAGATDDDRSRVLDMPALCRSIGEADSRTATDLMEELERKSRRISSSGSWSDHEPGVSVGIDIRLGDDAENERGRARGEGLYREVARERAELISDGVLALVVHLRALKLEDGTDSEKELHERLMLDQMVVLKPPEAHARRVPVERVGEFLESRYTVARESKAQREWNDIRLLLRSNRYCMTILLAAAQRIALSGRTAVEGKELAEAFIRRTASQAKATSRARRENVVLEHVLGAYQQFHLAGSPHGDMDLHRLIIRHVGVIGVPCSADVLVRTPAIREYFGSVAHENHRRRYSRLVLALSELVDRGLVFRLRPNYTLVRCERELDQDSEGKVRAPAEVARLRERVYGEHPGGHEHRYALHRLLQRRVVESMGSGPREFVEINNFAPSLHASMPADLPRLSQEAYGFLRSLVAALSQYPDQFDDGPSTENWHFAGAPLSTQVQALRAAMSTVRSIYSIAVVSRFEEYRTTGSERPAQRGFFEEYRVQVRWLIRKAAYLVDQPLDREDDPRKERDHLVTLYRDEIVWLYNECGVINLVQGNLPDAISLFNQAISLNRLIEGASGGAQHNRIALNLSLCLIECGRLDEASPLLVEISATEKRYSTRPGRVWHIARGYLGLIELISGDPAEAEKQLTQAINVLRLYGDSRACAVFLRHLGDLYRVREEPEPARRCLTEAIGFAETGGHEDLHQYARLAMLRLDLAKAHRASHAPELGPFLARLDVIDRYATTMEMPSLLCESNSVRGAILLDQGNLDAAGTLFGEAMVLAKRNGMTLRLNYAMTGYARVLHKRRFFEQARELLIRCLDLAKHHKDQLAIRRAEEAQEALDRSMGGTTQGE